MDKRNYLDMKKSKNFGNEAISFSGLQFITNVKSQSNLAKLDKQKLIHYHSIDCN